jgi:hypothetical protein
LYDLRARYYKPSDGRFFSRDTYSFNRYNPIELNRYSYTASNPINYSDPSGKFKTSSNLQVTQTTKSSANEYASLILNISFSAAVVAGLFIAACEVDRMISDIVGGLGYNLHTFGISSVQRRLCIRVSYVADSNIFGDSTSGREGLDVRWILNPNVILYVPPAVPEELWNNQYLPAAQHQFRFTEWLRMHPWLISPVSASIRPTPDGDISGVPANLIRQDRGGFNTYDAKILLAARQRNLPLLTVNQALCRQIGSGSPRSAYFGGVSLVDPYSESMQTC